MPRRSQPTLLPSPRNDRRKAINTSVITAQKSKESTAAKRKKSKLHDANRRISAAKSSAPTISPHIGSAADASNEISGRNCVVFEEDFTRLCENQGMYPIPPVIARCPKPLEPAIHSNQSTVKNQPMKRKSVGVKKVQLPPTIEKVEEVKVKPPEPYFTFTVKDYFTYFKPCIQVERMETFNAVKELYIRGWKVDMAMMGILSQCLPRQHHLRALHLWNAGINVKTFDMLAAFLPTCKGLSTLTLDANPLEGADLTQLLTDDVSGSASSSSLLVNLSLRFCELTDKSAETIGQALGTAKKWNQRLISLNLSNNRFGDVGARHIADGLKTNRTLLNLNLFSNRIGDDGAAAFAEVLSTFVLDKEQMRERRHQEYEDQKPPTVARSEPVACTPYETPSPVFSQSFDTFKMKDLAKQLAGEMLPRRASKLKKDSGKAPHSAVTSGRKEKIHSRFHRTLFIKEREEEEKAEAKPSHPLVAEGTLQDGQFWMRGNRSLISLNVGRNRIGEDGLRKLLAMVEMQALPRRETPAPGQCGLRRLVVQNQKVAEAPSKQVLELLRYHMATKDPFYKMPFVQLHRTNVTPCAIPINVA